MKAICVIAACMCVLGSCYLFAHSGGLDSRGGHYNRKTGEYHYHRPQGTPPKGSPSRITPPKIKPRSIAPSAPSRKLSEANYRDWWASKVPNAKTEVTMPDGTRCDIVTASHAIEVEWAYKWYEGFGQSLWYGYQANKTPGVVMILRTEADRKYVIRLRSLAKHHNIKIDVWVIGPGLKD